MLSYYNIHFIVGLLQIIYICAQNQFCYHENHALTFAAFVILLLSKGTTTGISVGTYRYCGDYEGRGTMFNQLLYKMKQASVYIIIFWVIINIISSSACTGVREQTVFAHYPKYQVTKHELKIKRSSRYLSKKVLDFYEDCVHKYAPFCNWSSDTIVLEMMTSMVDHDVVCYAFSTTTDSLLFSDWNCFDNELKQTAYPSIEEYYSPSRIGIFPGNFVQERIASLKNIKYWQTDSIENKIKIGEPLLSSEIVYRLIRIVIKDKKITSVSTYDCDPLTFYS